MGVIIGEKLVGRLSISRLDDKADTLVVTLADEASHKKFAKLEIPAAALIRALGGMYGEHFNYTFETGINSVGCTREVLPVLLPVRKDKIPKVPKKLAAQGWAYFTGYGNHHNLCKNDKGVDCYRCILERLLEPTAVFEQEE